MSYLGMREFQLRDEYEEWEREKKERKREEEMSGPLAYGVPFLMEYAVFPTKDIPRLKAYIRSTTIPGDVLRKAAKKGFSLYFQYFQQVTERGFYWTSGEIYGILNNVTERTMKNKPIIYCREYDQMIDPALCISRNIIYPREIPASPYYLEVKEKLERAITKQDKKRLRREVKRHSPTLDPYPKCRSCIMGRSLIQKSCLGAEFDLEDKECTECPSKKECCQLMRLRIESILEGDEDKVIQDILRSWKRLSHKRKEVKDEMAKKKKKAEEVTEEVIEETEVPTTKKGKKKAEASEEGATKTKSQIRAEKRKAARAAEKEAAKAPMTKAEKRKAARAAAKEDTTEPAPKKGKKKKEGSVVEKLLKQLAEAKEDEDQEAARKIRAELRAAGYSLRDQKMK